MKKKILIFEDEKILGSLLQKKIAEAGYEVTLALDGEEGLSLLKKEIPDLVLLDMIMPKIDGFGVILEMNKTKKYNLKKIPVIVISNSGQPVEIDKVLDSGVRDYLIKTHFNPIEVVEKIKKFI